MKKNKENRLSKFLEMPKEVVSNVPKITMLGFEEMIIENHKGILEYEEFYIRINTFIGIININGFNLRLNQLTDEAVSVTGKIESMDLESNTEE